MNRLDKELVTRKIVETRTKAQELIENGFVLVNNKVQTKTSSQVSDIDKIIVTENKILKYVSRGGLKLEKALDVFNYKVSDQIIMDIGSSTGGFTDCALQNGAKKCICIDVGSQVMHHSLRNHPQIDLHENTNIIDLDHKYFENIDVIVIDVSFVSLEKIIEKIAQEQITVDIICLIKPQFECGKDVAKKCHGIIKDKSIHKTVINNVINYFNKHKFYITHLDFSPIKGGDGNIEYIALFTNKTSYNNSLDILNIINNAHNNKF